MIQFSTGQMSRLKSKNLFNPANWFGGEEGGSEGEGDEGGAFSWLTETFGGTLTNMVAKVTSWLPSLKAAFIPEIGWEITTNNMFGGILTGVDTLLTDMKAKFSGAVVIIEGTVKRNT